MASQYSNTNLFGQSPDKFGWGPFDPSIAPAVQLLEKGVSVLAPFAGVVAQTVQDVLMDTTVTQVATNLNLYAIGLAAGDVINNFNVISVGAASTPAHWWFVLANSSFYPLAFSADQLTTATAADTAVTVPVATVGVGASGATTSTAATSYTVLTSGIYYVGLMQAPTTTAFTVQGHTANGAGRGALAPYLGFVSNTSASTVPAFGTALTSSAKATPTAVIGIYLN
jgi:hypothetical protein